jgi:hypothetical protein
MLYKEKFSGAIGSSLAIAALLAGSVAFAAAPPTAPGQNKIQCFDGTTDGGYGGTCTLLSKGAKGAATLDNTDGNANGSYSGVYYANSNLNGKTIGNVTHLSFSYTGEATAGSPRFSLPLDTDGDGVTDFYGFVSAYYCNDGAGFVDAINDSTCTIYAGSESFANWAAMVAAHPTWTITQDYAFLVADDPGIWTVSNVTLGKPGK